MKLLITTQAVDTNDSDLGFFVRWIEEFAKQSEKVTVICLRAGTYALPDNVEVTALGKTSRITRTVRLWRICIARRKDYDAVFVHMNPEYLIAAGFLWRFMSKRVALWYTHKSVNVKLRIAVLFANTIFTASRESFRLQTKKLQIMEHGIDTDFFCPDPSIARGDWALSVGRLMKSKRHDLAIQMAAREHRALRIVGEGPERARLEVFAHQQHAAVQFLGALTHTQVRDEYRTAAYLIHTSETGSLDKVVLEALACGLKIRTNDPALKSLEAKGPQYVREHHSLQQLIPRLIAAMSDHTPDPKAFYDGAMTEKLGNDYESARWQSSPILAAQYVMAESTIRSRVIPALRAARRILEVGPGPGTWTKLFLADNPNALFTLVDISRTMLDQARANLPAEVPITFCENDFLAFSDAELFDGFFSSRAIEYISDKTAVAEKIASLLADGARGAIITKMPKPFFNWLRGRTISDLHKGQISPHLLTQILQKAGFRVLSVYPVTVTVPVFCSAWLNWHAFRILRMFSLAFPLSIFVESYGVLFEKYDH